MRLTFGIIKNVKLVKAIWKIRLNINRLGY